MNLFLAGWCAACATGATFEAEWGWVVIFVWAGALFLWRHFS